ncbi:MAG TPA: response regulator transcription factor [Terriglobales bacterium]|jgi:DNA-binding NarL/FixJ family response regulator
MSSLRIFVADRDDVVRQVLAGIIATQPGWEICGEAGDGHEAVRKVLESKPDITICEVSLPGLYGLQAVLQIIQQDPSQKIIVLGTRDTDGAARDAFAAGALGYVLTAQAARALVPAIRALQDERTFFTPRMAELILHEYMEGDKYRMQALSPQERLALKFLAKEAASTVAYRPATRNRLPAAAKKMAIFAAVVITLGLLWTNFHDSLEEKYPFITRWLTKAGVEAPPPPAYSGNPDTRVWVDLQTGLYYCPGSKSFGKTMRGRNERQRDAQREQFEPADQKACE